MTPGGDIPRSTAPGPLSGYRVLEIGGMGPGPFAGMTLAGMGCEVVRIDRPGGTEVFPGPADVDILNRGKRSVALNLKHPDGVGALLTMAERADVLIEGYRPGVAERLGFGPDICLQRNPRLVYGRMTGWGQDGPLARTAGHDVNYIAITGALHAIGEEGGPPRIPINLVGDFGGGGMYLVAGVLAALLEAQRSGSGQVVDAAIIDGTAHLLAATHAMMNTGTWQDRRGVNLLDGGAPYYAVYETADGQYMAVGAMEEQFYAALIAGLGIREDLTRQNDRASWSATKERIAAAFRTGTQKEWTTRFAGTDACVSPVLSLRDAMNHPQIKTRGTIIVQDGLLQPASAPRFSEHPQAIATRAPHPGQDTLAVLADWGLEPGPLLATGAAACWYPSRTPDPA